MARSAGLPSCRRKPWSCSHSGRCRFPGTRLSSGSPRVGPTRMIGTGIFMSGSAGRGSHSRGWWAGLPGPAQTTALDEMLGEEQDSSHSYLFGRSGRPVAMALWLANRAAIIAVCSGSVLLLGFLLMFSRARFRVIWAVAASLCLVASALVHPSVLLLVIQSALSGVVLTLLGLLIQGLVERARLSAAPLNALPPSSPGPTGGGSSQLGPEGVGSDGSTAILPAPRRQWTTCHNP